MLDIKLQADFLINIFDEKPKIIYYGQTILPEFQIQLNIISKLIYNYETTFI